MAKLQFPHPKQLDILSDDHKFVTVVCGRRFGKTYTGILSALKVCLDFPQWIAKRGHPGYQIDRSSPCVVGVIMPTSIMVRTIYFKPLLDLLEKLPQVADINRSQMQIRFHGNRPDLILRGANDAGGDRLRGLKFVYVVLDEFQDMRPGVLDTVLIPAMSDTPGSQGLILGTPKGKLSAYYQVAMRHKDYPDSYSYHHYFTADNPFVPRDEIARANQVLPPRLFRQEYLAAWEDFPGKIYSELCEDNQVDALPASYDLTIMGYDFGDTNPAMAVLGRKGDVWYYLDGWAGDGSQPIPQPVLDAQMVRLATKHNISAVYCDPSRPTSILSIRTLGREYNQPGLQKAVAGYNRIEEGLNQCHSLIFQRKLMFLKSKTPDKLQGQVTGLEAYQMMSDYHRKVDKAGQVTEAVEDGQLDHICDAIRYALAVNRSKRL